MTKFKYILIIFFIIFIVFSVYGYFKAVPGAGKNQGAKLPRIEAIPDFFDFGEIEYGRVVKHTFEIKNSGEETLEIRRLSTSCACTSAKIEKEILKSGEKTELFVEYNTGLMTGAHAKGDQERIIYIKTNDPVNPQIEVTIKAYVK